MKKILVLKVAAITILALSGQRASAWCDWKFGVGLNLSYKGGGNNFLWGAYKSQQPPALGAPGLPGVVPAPIPAPIGAPIPGMYGQNLGAYAPGYGGGYEGGYGAYGAAAYNPGQENPAPATAQSSAPPSTKVQPVGYQYSANGQYGYRQSSTANYAPPPSYWYGK
jgi:hypothetical protein